MGYDFLQGRMRPDAVKKKRQASPEAAVGRAVDAYLHTLNGYIRQINSMGVMRNGRWTTGGQGSGISDRLCWLPNGKMIAVELKAPGKKRTVTEAQIKFLEQLVKRGFYGCVADGCNDVITCLSQTMEQQLETLNALKPKPRASKDLEPLFP